MRLGARSTRSTPAIAGVALVLALAGDAFAQRAWATPGQREAAEGRRQMEAGRCDSALQSFDDAIAQRTEDASLRRDRGLCHEQLGNTSPAIEDFRAYLSMEPGAPDAAPIRSRLDALEESRVAEAPPEPEPAPDDDEDDDEDEDEPTSQTSARLPSRGFLLGAHLGWRDWNDAGYRGATISYGIVAGYAYIPWSEIEARAALLQTLEADATGFSISAAHLWKFPIDARRRWEVVGGAGFGFETQQDDFRVRRNYFYGRIAPSARWSVHPSVVLQGGLEGGIGSMSLATELASDTTTDVDDSRVVYYWGVRFEVLWELSPRGGD